MKIAIINDIHASSGRRSQRLLSDLSLTNLDQTIQRIEKYNPNYILVLGDLIQNTNEQHDKIFLNEVLENFVRVKNRCLFTTGNHETRGIGVDYFSDQLVKFQFNSNLFGLVEFEDKAFIYLSTFEEKRNGQRYDYLPQEQIDWLADQLNDISKPVIIFSHHYLASSPQDLNYYVKSSGENYSTIKNTEEVFTVLNQHKSKIKALFCAHSHWLSADFSQDMPIIGLPSFAENLLSELYEDLHPQSWSLIDWSSEKLIVNVFNGVEFSSGQVVV